jgi:hypothetical protein
VIWHRAKRHGLSIEQQLSFTLDSYTTFIEGVIGEGFPRVLVLSAPLPTISDSPGEWGKVGNLRAEVTATRAERTNLTLHFNDEMRKRCEPIDAIFVDVTSDQLEPASGVIHPRFMRPNARNHHLADGPYSRLISRELSRIWPTPTARESSAA